jgi:hypothetical protein
MAGQCPATMNDPPTPQVLTLVLPGRLQLTGPRRPRHPGRRMDDIVIPRVLLAAGLALGCMRHPPPTSGPPAQAEAPAPPPACPDGELPPPRVWRLTHAQLRNTLLDVFGYAGPAVDALPPDSRLEGFANGADGLGVPPLLLEYYYNAADEVSTELVRRAGEVLTCPVAALGPGPCLDTFLATVGLRAWRRPLTAPERASLVEVFTAAAGAGPEMALKSVVEALIVSPNFIYRFELGGGGAPGTVTTLTDYELASALSYTLWDAPPDPQLLQLAAAGALHTPEALHAQAGRLFASARRASGALTSFLRQWLRVEELPGAGKDPMLFPMYDRLMARDLLEEIRLMSDGVVFDAGGDRSLRTLLTAGYGFINSKTSKIYGLKVRGGELTRTPLAATERRGLLTSAAFLAAHADADTTRVVDRGKFVREEVLCAEVPPPPDNFMFDETKITEDMTGREKLTAHAKNPFCANCHALFDGIGFALESYDAVGRYRTTDKDKPIDPTGNLPLPGRPPLHFETFVDLVDQIARLPEPYTCFATRYLGYATGRHAAGACEGGRVVEAFRASGYRLDTLVMSVIDSPGFSRRRN